MVSAHHRKQIPAATAWRSVPVLGFAGSLLLFAAFPPLDLRWLAWLAPLPWLILIRGKHLSGRRPFLVLWTASLVHWLMMLQGIRLAHWLLHFGWFALSAYLAAYLPVFVVLSRFAVHRLRLPLLVAAPVVWTGLELLRGYLFTGFSMGLLGHTQFEYPLLIQTADLGGAYAVSFLVMSMCAGVAGWLPLDGGRTRLRPLAVATCLLLVALAYGRSRLRADTTGESPKKLKVALIQSDFNTRFEFNPDRNVEVFERYLQVTEDMIARNEELDLVVWPESVFTENNPEIVLKDDFVPPAQLTREQYEEWADRFRNKASFVAARLNRVSPGGQPGSGSTHLMVGTERREVSTTEQLFNEAVLIGPSGAIKDRYDKMHPVMFGEYIPFGRAIPLIYDLAPLGRGLTPGTRPTAFEVNGVRLSTNICFESAVPHLIRGQFATLDREGRPPEVIVNLTHDGWFWGSSILDLQLAGAVFRAVELRRPFLVSANAGISAWIDDCGRIRARGPRQGEAHLLAEVVVRDRPSFYGWAGDWFGGLCLAVSALITGTAVITRILARRRPVSAAS